MYIYILYTHMAWSSIPYWESYFLLAMTFFSRFQVWPAGGLMTIPQENGSHHPTFDHGTHVVTRIV